MSVLMSEIVCSKYYFSGRVQGVGFRARTQSLSKNFKIVGYVKNLEDGRVELLVQGDPLETKKFLHQIHELFRTHIDETREQICSVGEWKNFSIQG